MKKKELSNDKNSKMRGPLSELLHLCATRAPPPELGWRWRAPWGETGDFSLSENSALHKKNLTLNSV